MKYSPARFLFASVFCGALALTACSRDKSPAPTTSPTTGGGATKATPDDSGPTSTPGPGPGDPGPDFPNPANPGDGGVFPSPANPPPLPPSPLPILPAPGPGPGPHPGPNPEPTPSNLCEATYKGIFVNTSEEATLKIHRGRFTLTGKNGQGHVDNYPGTGTCRSSAPGISSFRFTLNGFREYVFTGTITESANGSVQVQADEIVSGHKKDSLELNNL